MYSKRKKAKYSGLEPTTYYMYLEFKKKSETKMGLEHTHLAEMRTGTLVLLPS